MKTAVMGVSGYAGAELARLLLAHPRLQSMPPLFLARASAHPASAHPASAHPASAHEESRAASLTTLHPQLGQPGRAPLPIEPFSWEILKERGIDLLFLATPHEQSREWIPEALAQGLRVIDLSGAWRLAEAGNRAVYHFEDADAAAASEVQAASIYGLPELHRDRIAKARIIANPGCYATSIILALKPLISAGWLDLDCGIICDAKSGVSGAGKAATAKTHFMYAADNLSAYSLYGHRHLGELLEQLELSGEQITFTPHLLPIPRGILSTIYVRFTQKRHPEEVGRLFSDFYRTSPMVRLYPTPDLPQIQYSVRTSYCDLGFHVAPDQRRCTLVSCLDNLLKGAASQAVQNMNVMQGWKEEEGLL